MISTMNHRRNVNNPFANKNRKTVGYSDHRYGNASKEHGRKRLGHRSSLLFILMAAFFLYSFSSPFFSVSVEDYNVSPEPTQKTVKPTGKPTEKPTGKPTEKPTEKKRDENPYHDPQLDLGGSDLRNVPESDLLSSNGDIDVPESPKDNDSLKEMPGENSNIEKLTLRNVTILNVTASSVDDTNSTAGSDTIDTSAVNKTTTNTSSATDENENADSNVVEIKENTKASPNSTDVENSTANTTANATVNGTISEIMHKLGASANAADGVITSGNQTAIESLLNATGADEKVSVDTTAAATSPNATEVGKNETSTVNDADLIPNVVTNETDGGADATNSTNNTTIESNERGNLRGSN